MGREENSMNVVDFDIILECLSRPANQKTLMRVRDEQTRAWAGSKCATTPHRARKFRGPRSQDSSGAESVQVKGLSLLILLNS